MSDLSEQRVPGATWERVADPSALGYSADGLAAAEAFTAETATAAVVVVVGGVILAEWGEVDRKFMTHSTRKSFLSALYGKYVESGAIDPDRTLGDCGIDDEPPLTDLEKTATIRDCLKSRSGIYHDALYETPRMQELKPARGSHKPGTYWYYNNWDFNVLGTVFEQLTGNKVFEALKSDIAAPIGMESFEVSDGEYVRGDASVHAAYPFKITARDMARFGLLMLRGGDWAGTRVIPEGWVRESTRYHSDATLYSCDGYGYMWWVARSCNKHPHYPNVQLPEGTYSARGYRGHYILVIPDRDMVVVHRVDTFEKDIRVSSAETGTLVDLILQAAAG